MTCRPVSVCQQYLDGLSRGRGRTTEHSPDSASFGVVARVGLWALEGALSREGTSGSMVSKRGSRVLMWEVMEACSANWRLVSVDTCSSLSLHDEHDEGSILPHSLSFLSFFLSCSYTRLSSPMFHFSTDRLAGLDTMILEITTPPKVPTLIPSHSIHHDTYIPGRKLRKQKPHRETRPPLADKTASNNLVCNSTTPFRTHVHLPF